MGRGLELRTGGDVELELEQKGGKLEESVSGQCTEVAASEHLRRTSGGDGLTMNRDDTTGEENQKSRLEGTNYTQ
jgi:hypothetical protein